MRGFFMKNKYNEEPDVQLKLIMPSALINEHTTVYKTTGSSPFELRNTIPFYSNIDGVSLSVKNEKKENIKFLVSRTVDAISYDTPLRIDYYDWSEGINNTLDSLERIESQFEDLLLAGDDYNSKIYSNYKIALILPLFHVSHGEVVSKEKGSKLYMVHKKEYNKKSRPQINLDNSGSLSLDLPENIVFLLGDGNAVLKNTNDFVKIERSVKNIDELISIVSYLVEYDESK